MKKNKTKRLNLKLFNSTIAKLFYFLFGTLGIYYIIKSSIIESQPTIANLSILPSSIILLYYWFKLANLNSTSRIIFHALFSILLSLILVIGGQLNLYSQISWTIATVIKVLLGTFAIFPLLEILYSLLSDSIFKPNFKITKNFKLLALVIPLIICLIVWGIFFPGIYTYDMAAWDDSFSSGKLTSHWSITYGFFIRFFLTTSHVLFNNYEAGFAVAMFIQMFFICYVIYKIIIFTASQTKNKAIYYVSLFFFALTPFIATMAITDAQDTVFGGLFALLILMLHSIIHNPKYFKKKHNIIKFIVTAFILITIRNNGIICLFLLTIFIFFIKIPNKKVCLLSLLTVFLLNLIYTGPIFRLLNVEKNTTAIQEILGVPSQQIARSYYQNPSSFNDDNIRQLNAFYDLENSKFSDYQSYPLISDFTKSAFRPNYIDEHLFGYIGFWTSVGIKNPGNYIEAFLLNSIGFWYPMKNYNEPRIKLGFMNYPGFAMTSVPQNRPNMKQVNRLTPPNNALTDGLEHIVFNNGWYNIPIVAQLSSISLYSIIFLYCIGLLIKNKSMKLLVTLSPVIGLFITILGAPVAIYRYAFPIALLVPVFICLIVKTLQRKTT